MSSWMHRQPLGTLHRPAILDEVNRLHPVPGKTFFCRRESVDAVPHDAGAEKEVRIRAYGLQFDGELNQFKLRTYLPTRADSHAEHGVAPLLRIGAALDRSHSLGSGRVFERQALELIQRLAIQELFWQIQFPIDSCKQQAAGYLSSGFP